MFFENAEKNVDAKIMGSYQPEMVGQPGWQFVLGKKSGLFSVERFLRQIGKTLDKDKQSIVLDKIKELSLKERRLITLDEFKKFVADVSA
jgi:isopropylmalate/homocitrate/citramalate synthase